MSCQSSPRIAEKLPEVEFPTFPDPLGDVSQLEDGRVVMSLDYWLKIGRYVIETEAAIETVEAQRGR